MDDQKSFMGYIYSVSTAKRNSLGLLDYTYIYSLYTES